MRVCITETDEYIRFLFCKQKTAYEMRISDWSSDVCSSDLIDRRTALGVERDIAFPEQDGTEILAGQARQVAATAAAGFERLAAVMALTHHLHLRGRGEHVERAVAHHRVDDLPAFVGRELEQGFVDRGEGDVGVFRGLAVRGLEIGSASCWENVSPSLE